MANEESTRGRRIKPYRPGPQGDHGTKAEKRLAKRTGASLTPASGAIDAFKGDMVSDDFRIESKSTVKISYRIKLDELLKINQEALEKGEKPALVVQFVYPNGKPRPQGSWVMVREDTFKELTSGL